MLRSLSALCNISFALRPFLVNDIVFKFWGMQAEENRREPPVKEGQLVCAASGLLHQCHLFILVDWIMKAKCCCLPLFAVSV